MLEFLVCSLVTILPDFLFRRFAQGKRIGHEITLFSVWYELRWGITACLILTIALITVIFFYHPTTSNVSSLFRTVTILPEEGGRVDEVLVGNNQKVGAGELLFTLDSTVERRTKETAERRIEEVDAEMVLAASELAAAEGLIGQAQGVYDQAVNELERRLELRERSPNSVTQQQIDTLQNNADSTLGALRAAIAEMDVAQARITTQLPAAKSSAQAALAEAEAKLAKKFVYAGVTGTLEQFLVKPGDIVSPILRPAGILVPHDSGRGRFMAGFKQITTSVLKVGMIAEITCTAKPFEVIPMVVVAIQDVIPSGQFRPGDRLVDPQDLIRPGTILVSLDTLYEGQADGIPPGSKCIANAYTNSHDLIASGELSTLGAIYYHMVDTLGVVHALILRMQALMLPVQILVLGDH
jgi:multidrug resistance efflux pump